MTILLIDDDEVGTTIRAKVLRVEGYQVLCAFCGWAGIDQLTHHQVDLVILDFHLPDLNGDRVLPELKRLKPETPVILLAGILGIAEGNLQQADLVIVKGGGPRPLLAAIRQLVPCQA